MGQYPFVQAYIENLITDACAKAGYRLVTMRKEGSYSRYVAVISDGSTESEFPVPYDYMATVTPDKRVEATVADIHAMFPAASQAVETGDVAIPITDEEAASLPDAEVEIVDGDFEPLPPFDASEERVSEPVDEQSADADTNVIAPPEKKKRGKK